MLGRVLLFLFVLLVGLPVLAQGDAPPVADLQWWEVLWPIGVLILAIAGGLVLYRSVSPENAEKLAKSTDNALVSGLIGDLFTNLRNLIDDAIDRMLRELEKALARWKPELTPNQVDDIAKRVAVLLAEELKNQLPQDFPPDDEEPPFGVPPGADTSLGRPPNE